MTSIKVPLVLGKPKESIKERAFTVRMFFVSDDDEVEDANVFSVNIQGKESLKNFDALKDVGETRKMIVKEFRGILASQILSVEFSSNPRKEK